MKRYGVAGLVGVAAVLVACLMIMPGGVQPVEAHCQVPCGIYDDAARIARLHEDATTIGKAVSQMTELAQKHDLQSMNQMTRWITTKEDHASNIIKIVSEYFLTQKVKPVAMGSDGYDAYLKSLADHHAVMVAAMKTKQTVDANAVDKLQHAIAALASHYGG